MSISVQSAVGYLNAKLPLWLELLLQPQCWNAVNSSSCNLQERLELPLGTVLYVHWCRLASAGRPTGKRLAAQSCPTFQYWHSPDVSKRVPLPWGGLHDCTTTAECSKCLIDIYISGGKLDRIWPLGSITTWKVYKRHKGIGKVQFLLLICSHISVVVLNP